MNMRNMLKCLVIFVALCLTSCDLLGKETSKNDQKMDILHYHVFSSITDFGCLYGCSCGVQYSDSFIAEVDGESVLSWKSVQSQKVDYHNTSDAKTIAIRTDNTQDLYIDAPNDSIIHFGDAKSVTINSVAPNSYLEKSNNSKMPITIKNGHIKLENDLDVLVVSPTGSVVVSISKNLKKVTVNEPSDPTVTSLTFNKYATSDNDTDHAIITEIETKYSAVIETNVDISEIKIESSNASQIKIQGNSIVEKISIDENVADDFTSTEQFVVNILGQSKIGEILGLSSPSDLKIEGDSPNHTHCWIETERVNPSYIKEGWIIRTCYVEGCTEKTTRTELPKLDSSNSGFEISEDDQRIYGVLRVEKQSQDTFKFTLDSTNQNTDYSTAEYEWSVNFTDQQETGKSFVFTVPDGATYIIECFYKNKYGSGSATESVRK